MVLAEDVLGGAGELVAIKVLRRQYAYAGQKARPALPWLVRQPVCNLTSTQCCFRVQVTPIPWHPG